VLERQPLGLAEADPVDDRRVFSLSDRIASSGPSRVSNRPPLASKQEL